MQEIDITYDKIWGTTKLLFCKNNVEIHRIDVKRGGFCSKHQHMAKFNLFHVESGDLLVTIFKSDDIFDVEYTYLSPGMSLTIPPGQVHMFEAITNCVAYETYWTELNADDIIRHESGGIKKYVD